MGSEWQQAKLRELYEISSGLSKAAKYFGSGYPFLAFKDVFKNFFIPNQLSQLVESSDPEQRKCSVKRGDVFLTRTSETMDELGMSSVALKDYERATFNGFTKRLRPKENNNLVPEYVGYYLRSPKFRQEMLAFSTMSTRASLNNEMISRLSIAFPSVKAQKVIGGILKTLDDKIALNHQINTTLESMAQALFKSWFVDFDPVIDNALAAGNPIPEELKARADARATLGDHRKPLPDYIRQQFPGRFVQTEEMGWVPEGWQVVEIGSALERLKVKKRYKKGDVLPSGRTPVFEQGADILLGYHDQEGEIEASPESPAFIFGDHTCVTKLSTEAFSVSQNVIPLRGSQRNSYWTYFAIRDKQQFEEYRRHWMEFAVKKISLPTQSLTDAFAHEISPTIVRQSGLSRQSDTLRQLRDTLLPKLLSGELRVPEAEQQMAEFV